jgi:hypothetical protein
MAVDGWWFVRNAVLYGDPTTIISRNRYELGDQASYGTLADRLPEAIHNLPEVVRSFFALFGRYVLTSNPAFSFLGFMTLIGLLVGLPIMYKKGKPLSLVLFAWIGITILETLTYTIINSNNGRFLFPAIAPLALVVAVGWSQLASRATWLAPALLYAGLATASACAWLVVAPAYAYAPTVASLPATARPLQATFDGAVELVGVDAAAQDFVEPGKAYEVTLYWRRTGPLEVPLSSFVHVDSDDPNYRAGSGYEGAPGHGLYPPNFWPEGQIIVDHHQLILNPDQRPDRFNSIVLRVRTGMYYQPPVPGAPLQRVTVEPASAADSGLELAVWKIKGQASPPPQVTAHFAGGLDLLDAQVLPASGSSLPLRLMWRASAPLSSNYTVFAQVLSRDGTLIGQHDSYPLDGRYPTSEWSSGETVMDTVALSLKQAPQCGDTVVVGLYMLPSTEPITTDDGQTLVRLPLAGC